MHSYNSQSSPTSTESQVWNLAGSRAEMFTRPTGQRVQALNSAQKLDQDLESGAQLSLLVPPNEHGHPPILLVDDDLPAPTAFLVEPVKVGRFKLYANDATHQEYAGHYYDFEVVYFLKHWPRLPAPSVAEFMTVAEQVISRGYVPPSQMSNEQMRVLKGVV